MSQRSARTSLARSPWRWARGIMAASRCGLRAPMRLRAVAMSRSASSGVRYSRGRRAALGRRRGGTFPFTVVGPLPCVTRFPSRLLGAGSRTFPFRDQMRTVARGGWRSPADAVLDNYATHKHPGPGVAGAARSPRWSRSRRRSTASSRSTTGARGRSSGPPTRRPSSRRSGAGTMPWRRWHGR
jgi:hypothetical protein